MALLADSDTTFFFFVFFFVIFILLAPRARSDNASFNSMDMSLKVESDALIGLDQMLPLTKEYNGNIGHVSSPQLIHLWDKSTNKLANFNTTFDFFIDGAHQGDGLTFFLASPEFTIPEVYAIGTFLGLSRKESTHEDLSYSKVLALEIDTVKNDCDPKDKGQRGRLKMKNGNKRMGIYISSSMTGISSLKCLICDEQQFQGTVKFEYDSSSKELKADMTLRCNDENIYNVNDISFLADLRLYLPEYVKIGFSVATAGSDDHQVASYRIANWSFNSSL